MRPRPSRRALPALAATLLAAGLLAVGLPAQATAAPARTWHVLVGAQSPKAALQTMGFYPRSLWVDQGDTVVWKANSAEIHTVTFLATTGCSSDSPCSLPQGFDPADPVQSAVQGGGVYDGTSYFNSGLLTSATGDSGPLPPTATVGKTYRLTFPRTLAPGTYTYYCLVHGKAMQARVIVQEAGTAYPLTQRQYDQRATRGIHSSLADGARLWASARRSAVKASRRHHRVVLVGAMDRRAMVMRFIRHRPVIQVGDKVTFMSTSMGEPHTLTFGNDMTGCGAPAAGPPCNPEAPWNVSLDQNGNEVANYPASNGSFSGDPANLNSGLLLGLPPALSHLPSKLTVTFTKAGRYHFVCALHDYMGMVGTVVVRPAS